MSIVRSWATTERRVEREKQWEGLMGDKERTDMNAPLDFVIVDDELLLQHFDRIEPVRLLLLRQHDLPEVTLT